VRVKERIDVEDILDVGLEGHDSGSDVDVIFNMPFL
jgi:hypothetical protein